MYQNSGENFYIVKMYILTIGEKKKKKEEEILLMAQKQAPPAPTPSAPKEDPIKAKSWKNQWGQMDLLLHLPQNNNNNLTPDFTYG